MNPQHRSTCPDCHSEMKSITVIDATDKVAFKVEGAHYAPLCYGEGEPRARVLRGGLEPVGTVEARMCSKCGRILLYGRPDR